MSKESAISTPGAQAESDSGACFSDFFSVKPGKRNSLTLQKRSQLLNEGSLPTTRLSRNKNAESTIRILNLHTFSSISITEEPDNFRRFISQKNWKRIRTQLYNTFQELPHRDKKHLHETALLIARAIDILDPFMDHLCAITCPYCQDICCHASHVFYNETDLFYLTALGEYYPEEQTRTNPYQKYCHYWMHDLGCTIDRIYRPYVCVWFLCEAQMQEMTNTFSERERRIIADTYRFIRVARLYLTEIFLKNTGGANVLGKHLS